MCGYFRSKPKALIFMAISCETFVGALALVFETNSVENGNKLGFGIHWTSSVGLVFQTCKNVLNSSKVSDLFGRLIYVAVQVHLFSVIKNQVLYQDSSLDPT